MANTTGKKFGGRKKGTPNKVTKEIRSVLKDLIYYELDQIEKQLNQLEPKERLEILIKLMAYALPKVEGVSYNLGEPMDWDY